LLGAAAKALISGKSGADVATRRADGKDRLREKAHSNTPPCGVLATPGFPRRH